MMNAQQTEHYIIASLRHIATEHLTKEHLSAGGCAAIAKDEWCAGCVAADALRAFEVPTVRKDFREVLWKRHNAEWVIVHGVGPEDYTHSCSAHLGEMMTDASEHRIYRNTDPSNWCCYSP